MIQYLKNYPLGTTNNNVQEAGRAGQDEIRAEAILFEGKTGKFCKKKMKSVDVGTFFKIFFVFIQKTLL